MTISDPPFQSQNTPARAENSAGHPTTNNPSWLRPSLSQSRSNNLRDNNHSPHVRNCDLPSPLSTPEQLVVPSTLYRLPLDDSLEQQDSFWVSPTAYNHHLQATRAWDLEYEQAARASTRCGAPIRSTAVQSIEALKRGKEEKVKVVAVKEEEVEEQAPVEIVKPRSRRRRQTKKPNKLAEELATATKRVKGKRIERAFIIGSEAWLLEDDAEKEKRGIPKEHTKGWRVYVKVPEGQPNVTTWLKKVQFKIFHTYPNPTRVVEEPPFQIEETGWGGFNVDIKLFFAPEVGSRPHDRTHFLQLEHYGSEADQEKQKKEKLVRSELLDVIEFNEPTETLFDLLTDEAQFRPVQSKGKGKGKARGAPKKEEGEEYTVEFPERSTATNPYSKEMEKQTLEALAKAQSRIDEMLKAEDEKLVKIKKEKAALMAGGSVKGSTNNGQ